MAKWPYYPMYVDDFDQDDKVRSMPAAAIGIFVLCLNSAWRDGSISADLEQVALDIRRKFSEVQEAWASIARCWVPADEPGRLVNPKQEEIRCEVHGKSTKAKASADERWRQQREREAANRREGGSDVENMRTHRKKDANASETCERMPETMRTHQKNDANGHAKSMHRAFGSDSVYKESNNTSLLAPPPPLPPLSPVLDESDPGYWAEHWYERHPKKRDMVLVPAVVAKMLQRGVDMAAVDAVHAAKCRSEDWTKQSGRFCPSLAQWLEDRGWTEGGASPPQFTTPTWRPPEGCQ